MEWVETTGRTIEEAKDAALDELGVDEQDAEFEVLEDARVGLFGRLRTEARVRARVRPTSPRPKEDRRDKRRRRNGGSNGTGAGRTERAPAADADGPATAPPLRPRNDRNQRLEREQRGNDVEEEVPLARQTEVAESFLAGLLKELEASATVAVREVDDETVELAITGEDLGVLIGPKGAALQALQEVTRTVVQRQTGARTGRILVDVSGYRQKRREALERFTREQADAVRASGERRVLEPMHPADRKVVHDTVNAIEGVRTVSEGEEPRRRVVIVPEGADS